MHNIFMFGIHSNRSVFWVIRLEFQLVLILSGNVIDCGATTFRILSAQVKGLRQRDDCSPIPKSCVYSTRTAPFSANRSCTRPSTIITPFLFCLGSEGCPICETDEGFSVVRRPINRITNQISNNGALPSWSYNWNYNIELCQIFIYQILVRYESITGCKFSTARGDNPIQIKWLFLIVFKSIFQPENHVAQYLRVYGCFRLVKQTDTSFAPFDSPRARICARLREKIVPGLA